MQRKTQKSQATPPNNPHLNPDTLIALAEELQNVITSILASTPQEPPEIDEPEPKQIRCYSVPAFCISDEREILQQYETDSLIDLFENAICHFRVTSFLLKNFNESIDMNGQMIQMLGESLTYPIGIINKLASIVADYQPHPDPVAG
ncbi:hypothetical protein C4J81_02645 [Deltaproteobacteria bacterium Smac51]|nr:hypothetical protein C4J81_02645 [Deltaproteobacteria bacterium Smac51]